MSIWLVESIFLGIMLHRLKVEALSWEKYIFRGNQLRVLISTHAMGYYQCYEAKSLSINIKGKLTRFRVVLGDFLSPY